MQRHRRMAAMDGEAFATQNTNAPELSIHAGGNPESKCGCSNAFLPAILRPLEHFAQQDDLPHSGWVSQQLRQLCGWRQRLRSRCDCTVFKSLFGKLRREVFEFVPKCILYVPAQISSTGCERTQMMLLSRSRKPRSRDRDWRRQGRSRRLLRSAWRLLYPLPGSSVTLRSSLCWFSLCRRALLRVYPVQDKRLDLPLEFVGRLVFYVGIWSPLRPPLCFFHFLCRHRWRPLSSTTRNFAEDRKDLRQNPKTHN